MKLNRILFAALIASITGSSITSCSESFLDENLTTQYSTDRFKTQEGLDELVTGAYQKLKFKFNYIWGIQCYNMGVDEFTDANNVIPAWNHYSQDLNSSENAANQPIWDNYYGLVEPANILIQNIPQYYNQSSPTYNTRLGEAHFLRAYAYFELVKQFGGVPLKLVPSTSAETYLHGILLKKYTHRLYLILEKPTDYFRIKVNQSDELTNMLLPISLQKHIYSVPPNCTAIGIVII